MTHKKSEFVLLFFETDTGKISSYRAFIFPLYLLLLIDCKLFQTYKQLIKIQVSTNQLTKQIKVAPQNS
jgi:hypothetical protein